MRKKIDCIVPGETDEAIPLFDPARWRVKCVCGEVHPVTFTKYWDEDHDGKLDDRPTEHWCFICVETGLHMQLEDKPPYRILKTVQYKPSVIVTHDPSELDGDELAKMFE